MHCGSWMRKNASSAKRPPLACLPPLLISPPVAMARYWQSRQANSGRAKVRAHGSAWNLRPGPQGFFGSGEAAGLTPRCCSERKAAFLRERKAWRLLSRGLPAIPSTAAACAESHCLVAMSNGGLYQSEESLAAWRRVDSDGERGKVSEILVDEKGGFLVGSEQEGMLRFVSRE